MDNNNKNLIRNIKVLAVVFTVGFLSIFVYLTYFNLYVGDKILDDPSNKRIRAEENKTLRGSILDRNGKVIAHSERGEDGNQKRVYNDGSLFSHVVGYNSYVYGKSGIEKTFNDTLQGKSGGQNILGTMFRSLREDIEDKEKRGNDVVLTLNEKLQKAAVNALGSDKGAIVAVNPKTGEVLAMASTPSFDPNKIDSKFKDYNKDEKNTPLLNRATQGFYPPGSVFKIVTATAAIETMPNIASETVNCTGALKFGNYTLKDYGGESHGKISMAKAIEKSCNYYFGNLGTQLGFDKLISTAEKFMFNKKIPDDMAKYSIPIKTGSIKVDDPKSKSYMAQDAIGQHNVAANPMQMVMVASAVANNGNIMTPYVVKEVKDRYGVVVDKPTPKILSEAMKPETAKELKEYMINVVNKGTGKNAKISGVQVAGKTGSAQDTSKNATHAWFMGFAPANDPEIAIAVVVEDGGLGGKRAATAAKQVLEAYFNK